MWSDYLKLILEKYKDKPDNFSLSIGHWEPEEFDIPAFRAYLAVTIGELRSQVKPVAV